MPEGDTIHRAAAMLAPFLVGKTVRELAFPRKAQLFERLHGKRVEAVRAVGKHLIVDFEGALALHTHMKMNGAWRSYAPGAPRPSRASGDVVVWLEVDDGWLAVCRKAPIVRVMRARDLAHDLARIGPDLIDAGFDRQDALARLRARPAVPLGEALLDQEALAGIGNVWKSELLFELRLDPFAPTAAFIDDELLALIDRAASGLRRSAKGADRPGHVYSRSGELCVVCGTRIQMRRQGELQRSTYFCASCQPTRSAR